MLRRIILVAVAALAIAGAAVAQTQDGGAGVAAERIDIDDESFVEGNLYFVAYHEIGHALISEFQLPVVGREEDAVDGLSTSLMTPDDGETAPDYLMGAIKGWFLFAAEEKLDDIAWWDEHGTSQQRAYHIACLLYGADEKTFKDAAEAVQLPEDRRQSCVADANQNSTSWDALLSDDSYGEDEKPDATAVAPEVIYEPTEKLAEQQAFLKKLGLLEDISQFMHTTYKLKPGIQLAASECGAVNAYWNASDRKLTLCYELVSAYQNMVGAIEAGEDEGKGGEEE